jgi:DNA-binding GntR family transcriptional regulator
VNGKTTLAEQIYNAILDRIMRNEFPMDRFLTEAHLVESFEASRAPVREALVKLCNENILRSIPRTGYQIIQLSMKDINDAIRTRVILETGGAKEVLHNMTPNVIEQLEESIAQAEQAKRSKKGSLEAWWKNNTDFHIRISLCAGNVLLTDMVRKTMAILWRATAQFFWNQEPISYWTYHSGGHVVILEAIKERDEKTLVDVLTKDVVALKNIFEIS